MITLETMNVNDLTTSELLAKLAAAESTLFAIVPMDGPRHELLTIADKTKLSLAAFDCRHIRLELIKWLDERNHNQEDE